MYSKVFLGKEVAYMDWQEEMMECGLAITIACIVFLIIFI